MHCRGGFNASKGRNKRYDSQLHHGAHPVGDGQGRGGWRGKIVDRSSRSFEEIAAAVAKRTGGPVYYVQSIFTGFMEETIPRGTSWRSPSHQGTGNQIHT